ncbi:mechanosensitive ion channel domain-containing protein [Haloarchaeobius amylolyticus]|uniref:mechanosensitive ion channel domain-containing protein n=1 Tax=Haloarchaeobius amylolyticus TaxID=1198296 RepID=UPI00226FF88E|nr:mechanosensitive ion channel domain-containing protein [Haloarchaeobius amylolyticus]
MAGPADFLVELVQETFTTFQAGVLDAFPRLVMGLVFLTLSYVGIKIALRITRSALDAIYPDEQDLIVSLGVTVAGLFLWFAAGLALLKILGMGDVAASLGTATGFIALGVSYALSGMIADTVAGVYLLRDPDFNPGYRVTTDGVTGEVRSIGLRKSRIELDGGDVVVLANGAVEKKWTKEGEEPAAVHEDS